MKLVINIFILLIFFGCVQGKIEKSEKVATPGIAAPIVSNVFPVEGISVGGTTITVSGSNLNNITNVTVAGLNCSSLTILSSSALTCVTAASTENNADIVVKTSEGAIGSLNSAFHFIPLPTITNVSPSQGAVAGGTVLTITGTNFSNTGGNPTISIGGYACTGVFFFSSTSVQCTLAAGPGVDASGVTASLQNVDTQTASMSLAYNFAIAPTISSVSLPVGSSSGGTNLTIAGTGFVNGATMAIDGVSCNFLVVQSVNSISCIAGVHAAAQNLDIIITNGDGQVSNTLVGAFSYLDTPTLTTVSPSTGTLAGGNTITLTGTNFGTGAKVYLDNVLCLNENIISLTSMTCEPQSITGTVSRAVDVKVLNQDSQSITVNNGYTFIAAPVITSLSVSEGVPAGGTAITITGTGFISGVTLDFGGSACEGPGATPPVVVSSTQITCTTTAGTGAILITITNPDTQFSTSGGLFEYKEPAPSISNVVNSAGTGAGGTAVVINGSNFVGVTGATFGGVACTGLTFTATTVNCTTPASGLGAVDVVVTNGDTQTGTLTSGYTYQAAPTVLSVAYDKGSINGGTNIVITGTGFVTGASVVFDVSGTSAICTVTASTTTTIDCTTAPRVAGTVAITVTNLDTQSGVSGAIYTFRDAPTITSLSVANGPTAGGTTTVVNGTGFLGFTSLTFGGDTCVGATVNGGGTQITCTSTPAHTAGAVDVVVTSDDSQTATSSSGFDYRAAPNVTSVDYPKGPIGGTQLVHIYGTNFVSTPTVDFSGTNCGGVTFIDSTHLTCTTAARAAGIVSVNVTNPDTQIGILASGYEYQDAPTVASISPNGGPLAGGTSVDLIGTNFFTGMTIDIGGSNCSTVVITSTTQASCTTTTHSAGTETVTVLNLDSQTGNQAGIYSYQAAPTITSLSPNAGSLGGGTTVTITGTNFHLIADGTTVVDFDTSNCGTVNVASDTSMTCVTTSHIAGSVTVKVTNPDTQFVTSANAYTYQDGPTASSISPNVGKLAVGTSVTITGTNFDASSTVSIGAASCTSVTYNSATSLTCLAPVGVAGDADVVVTNPDSQIATLTNGYKYAEAPTITSVTATLAPTQSTGALAGNTAVTITGDYFITGASITFDGTVCTSVAIVDAQNLTCNTPTHAAGLVDVIVTNADTQTVTSSNAYEYIVAPTATSLSVTSGPAVGSTAVTITGTDFVSAVKASFGGVDCTGVVFGSSTSFSCNTAIHAAGLVDVLITNPDTQAVTMSGAYTYKSAPVVTSISPELGAATGGTVVTLTGTDFEVTSLITIGAVNCTPVIFTSVTSINCTTGAKAAGVATDIIVTNADSQTGTKFGAYTYTDPPTVTSLDVVSGPSSGGTTIIITGTNFLTGAVVDLDGSACTSVVVNSATQITCVTAAHTKGSVGVKVTNTDTLNATLAAGFLYQDAPVFTSIDKPGGPLAGLTNIIITGTDFATGVTVTVDGTACTPVSDTATTIECTLPGPKTEGAKDVVITNLDTQSVTATGAYAYQVPPTVVSVTPTAGSNGGGDLITITGTKFVTGLSATVGGVACTGVTFISDTSMTCTTGGHAVGAVTVEVTNADNQLGNKASAFLYAIPPSVTSVSPAIGSIGGSTDITITGTDFSAPATVDIGGATCASVTVVSATSITCTTSALAAGVYDIKVTNADSQNDTLAGSYTYVAMAVLEFQGTGAHDYGSVNVNTTATFTLENTGDITSDVITTSLIGSDPAYFAIGTNTCSATTLIPTATCTIQVTFLGATAPSTATYNASLQASATEGGTVVNTLVGEAIP